MTDQSLLFEETAKSPRVFRWLRDGICRNYLKRRSAAAALRAKENIHKILKGNWGTEVCWTDENLRAHIVKRVEAAFALDDFQRTQLLISFYLEKKLTTAIVDQQISDMRDLQDGAAAQGLCGPGKGWNPVRVMNLIKKATGYHYAYVPLHLPIWASRFCAGKNTPEKIIEQQIWSPLVSFEGTRGCVRKLDLTVDAPLEAEAECLNRFRGIYEKITPDFFVGHSDDDLRSAIEARTGCACVIGAVAARFTWEQPQTDPGETAKRVARLVLTHGVES